MLGLLIIVRLQLFEELCVCVCGLDRSGVCFVTMSPSPLNFTERYLKQPHPDTHTHTHTHTLLQEKVYRPTHTHPVPSMPFTHMPQNTVTQNFVHMFSLVATHASGHTVCVCVCVCNLIVSQISA